MFSGNKDIMDAVLLLQYLTLYFRARRQMSSLHVHNEKGVFIASVNSVVEMEKLIQTTNHTHSYTLFNILYICDLT